MHLHQPNSGSLWEMTRFAQVTTLIGAGGKSTTLEFLAREIHALGRKVIATTTTKVYPMPFESVWYDPVLPPPLAVKYPCFWYAGVDSESEKNKWIGPKPDRVDQAIGTQKRLGEKIDRERGEKSNSRVWVIEGDGAREKKLKCWNSHEPQIPMKSECAVLLLHGKLWGKVLTDREVYRPEKCPGISGQVWTVDKAVDYFLNSPVFDLKYRDLFWVIVFNEYEDNHQGEKMKDKSGDEWEDKSEDKSLRLELLEQLGRERNRRIRPVHLRIASGDVKGGRMTWYDLW